LVSVGGVDWRWMALDGRCTGGRAKKSFWCLWMLIAAVDSRSVPLVPGSQAGREQEVPTLRAFPPDRAKNVFPRRNVVTSQ
jgi:hypothetical protein